MILFTDVRGARLYHTLNARLYHTLIVIKTIKQSCSGTGILDVTWLPVPVVSYK